MTISESADSIWGMNYGTRSVGYIRPAGQAANVTAQLSGIPAGVNAQGQLVDSQGTPIVDSSGNPITIPTQPLPSTAPVPSPVPAPVPAPAPAPTPGTTTPSVQHPAARAGSMFFGFVLTAALVAGASYVGSYFGAKHAHRTGV